MDVLRTFLYVVDERKLSFHTEMIGGKRPKMCLKRHLYVMNVLWMPQRRRLVMCCRRFVIGYLNDDITYLNTTCYNLFYYH